MRATLGTILAGVVLGWSVLVGLCWAVFWSGLGFLGCAGLSCAVLGCPPKHRYPMVGGDRTEGKLANNEHPNRFVVAPWSLRHLGSRAPGRSVGAPWALCGGGHIVYSNL